MSGSVDARGLAVKTVKKNKLGKRLRSEAAANPKKVMILGLVTCVALYFWAPLVWGWMRPDRATGGGGQGACTSTPSSTMSAASATQTVAAPATDNSKPASTPPPCWNEVAEWMHNDPRTMIAPPLTKTRDPFELPLVEVAKKKPETKADDRRRALASIAGGLILTSTIVGPQRRVAQINGRIYAVGQVIDAKKENDSERVSFQLIEVHPRRAVLQSGDERFELTIPEPSKSEKVEILGAIGSI